MVVVSPLRQALGPRSLAGGDLGDILKVGFNIEVAWLEFGKHASDSGQRGYQFRFRSAFQGLEINNNDALTSLQGFRELTSVGSWLSISENDLLEDIDGFESLTEVGGLEVRENDMLTSLRGLSAVRTVGAFYVYDHPMLPACEVAWLRDNILAQPGGTIGGPFLIRDNSGTGTCD